MKQDWRMSSMKKSHSAFVIVALGISLGTSAVIAQSNPIAARQALMKGNDDGARVVVAMMRGRAPFDAGKVDAVFAQWTETAQKLPGLFPPDSKTGQKTRAAPKIWETKSDFDAKAAEFGKVVADNRDKAKASPDGLKVAVSAVGKACDNCHEGYRLSSR
jgi:cytochrome c556